jgi:hypothetical protein
MPQVLFWTQQAGIVLCLIAAVLAVAAVVGRRENRIDSSLFALALLAPAVLWFCWWSQFLVFRKVDTLLWSRLMAGDVAELFRVGSAGLLFGALLATAALALGRQKNKLYLASFMLASLCLVLLLHPTPHYVPVPVWLDKLTWLALLAGGAVGLVVIHQRYRRYFEKLRRPVSAGAALVALAALASLVALNIAARPLELAPLSAEERIRQMGCLSCHTMAGIGYPISGGGLEASASRDEQTLLTFMRSPDVATTRALGIRSEPTGEMAGLHLAPEEVLLLVEAMRELFPPASELAFLDSEWREVERILAANSCLACHSLYQEGAPGGGSGGPLEASTGRDFEVLKRWLITPTPEMARELGLAANPTGAMAAFPLSEEEASLVAAWLRTLAAPL